MAYWLEKRTVQKKEKASRIIWKRYAICSSSKLLERVRMGQEHPEHWQVVLKSARTRPVILDGESGVSECRRMKSGCLICTAADAASI